MITVLYICSSYNLDGAARSLWNLLESVNERVKPIVFCIGEGAAYDFFVKHGIECYICPLLLVFGTPQKWSWYLFHPWRIRSVKGIRFFFRALRIIRREHIDTRIDLIHTNSSATVLGLRLSRFLKKKLIWHIRENREMGVYWQGKLFVEMARLKRLINCADARVFVSNQCREFWQGITQCHTWTLWDAVCSVKDCCYYKEKQPYFLFCSSRITKGKGLDTAIAAFGRSELFKASAVAPSVRLKIIGFIDNDCMREMIALANSYQCAEYIDFLPVQDDVRPFFAYALAFVNPSVNEGLGRTTAEAMFWGCPVLAYAGGGTLDLVQDGENGYLFHTVEECAALMTKVCNTKQEEIILHAQEFAKQNLSVEGYGQKIMAVYETVLGLNQ